MKNKNNEHSSQPQPERGGFIDGLPNTYLVNYLLDHDKCCGLCGKKILKNDLDKNRIVLIEIFGFSHKDCIKNSGISYRHQRSHDRSSMTILTCVPSKFSHIADINNIGK